MGLGLGLGLGLDVVQRLVDVVAALSAQTAHEHVVRLCKEGRARAGRAGRAGRGCGCWCQVRLHMKWAWKGLALIATRGLAGAGRVPWRVLGGAQGCGCQACRASLRDLKRVCGRGPVGGPAAESV